MHQAASIVGVVGMSRCSSGPHAACALGEYRTGNHHCGLTNAITAMGTHVREAHKRTHLTQQGSKEKRKELSGGVAGSKGAALQQDDGT